MRIAICDDDEAARARLTGLMRQYMEERGRKCRIDAFESGEALLRAKARYDVALLDIQMQGATGMEVARALRQREAACAILFATISEEYVFDAFEVEAVDYLVKPVDSQRFRRAMDRALQRAGQAAYLSVKKYGECRLVRLADVRYFEVMNRTIYIHMEVETIDYCGRLEELSQKLDGRFFRCHRSYIVNLSHVAAFAGGMAQMDTGERIPVSRLRAKEFMEAMLRNLGESR